MKRNLFTLLIIIVAVAMSACDPKDAGATARVVKQSAVEAKGELADMRQRDEIDEEGAKQFTAYFGEVETSAGNLEKASVNWNTLTKAERRRVLVKFIGELGGSADRLDQQGYLGIKSAKARKRVDNWKRELRRGLSVLRIIEAALPVEESSALRIEAARPVKALSVKIVHVEMPRQFTVGSNISTLTEMARPASMTLKSVRVAAPGH